MKGYYITLFLIFALSSVGIHAHCSVCGRGKRVGNGNAIYVYPNNRLKNITCSELELAGFKGLIKIEECAFYPFRVVELCECRGTLRGSPSPKNDDDSISSEDSDDDSILLSKEEKLMLIPLEGDDDDEEAEIPRPKQPEKKYKLPRLGDDDTTELMD
eukprot:CAMPEP_0194256884 /NCGR_PEP_ID=MMETSP0158-20130606/37753_1 /TAXON_ID=33649 /ORGANISM="Thalassionema nitzschioides, Strain L26-B" /LENGTH=157 /DNA_ID=CAMNT_0038995741 /DNA_START=58 /DNA_END=531 /DNA_ORIENTATION=-